MKEKFKILTSDKTIKYSLIVSIIVWLLATVMIAVLQTMLPPLIPFFNSMPWGEERLASSWWVLSLPVIFLCILVANYILSGFFYKNHPLMARLLVFNALLFLLLGLLAYLQIVFLVL